MVLFISGFLIWPKRKNNWKFPRKDFHDTLKLAKFPLCFTDKKVDTLNRCRFETQSSHALLATWGSAAAFSLVAFTSIEILAISHYRMRERLLRIAPLVHRGYWFQRHHRLWEATAWAFSFKSYRLSHSECAEVRDIASENIINSWKGGDWLRDSLPDYFSKILISDMKMYLKMRRTF